MAHDHSRGPDQDHDHPDDRRSAGVLALIVILLGAALFLLGPKNKAKNESPGVSKAVITAILSTENREANGAILTLQ